MFRLSRRFLILKLSKLKNFKLPFSYVMILTTDAI